MISLEIMVNVDLLYWYQFITYKDTIWSLFVLLVIVLSVLRYTAFDYPFLYLQFFLKWKSYFCFYDILWLNDDLAMNPLQYWSDQRDVCLLTCLWSSLYLSVSPSDIFINIFCLFGVDYMYIMTLAIKEIKSTPDTFFFIQSTYDCVLERTVQIRLTQVIPLNLVNQWAFTLYHIMLSRSNTGS